MKLLLTFAGIVTSHLCFSQTNYVIQNNSTSVLILPNSIESTKQVGSFTNTGFGYNALFLPQTGRRDNTAVGYYALSKNATGTPTETQANGNTGLGYATLANNELGAYNTAVGGAAIYNDINGSYNTAVGYGALTGNLNSYGNTAVGFYALNRTTNTPVSSPDAGDNTALGILSLYANQTGNNNLGLGQRTLYNNINGNYNIAIGSNAGYNETGSHKLYIENSNSSTPLIGGDFSQNRMGVNRDITAISLTNYTFQVGGDASKDVAGNWASHSDARLKKNIRPLDSELVLKQVLRLKGVTYEWSDNVTNIIRPKGLQYGFVAQNIQKVFPTKVKEDAKGYLMTAYGDYDPMMVEAIRALNNKIERLENENKELKNLINNELAKLRSEQVAKPIKSKK
ncbi:MAG TPA: tail fiber domain-containing protein [Emticicia sp.]